MLVVSIKSSEFTVITIPPCDKERTMIVGVESVKGNTVRFGIVADRAIKIGRSMYGDKLVDRRDPKLGLDGIPTRGEPLLCAVH